MNGKIAFVFGAMLILSIVFVSGCVSTNKTEDPQQYIGTKTTAPLGKHGMIPAEILQDQPVSPESMTVQLTDNIDSIIAKGSAVRTSPLRAVNDYFFRVSLKNNGTEAIEFDMILFNIDYDIDDGNLIFISQNPVLGNKTIVMLPGTEIIGEFSTAGYSDVFPQDKEIHLYVGFLRNGKQLGDNSALVTVIPKLTEIREQGADMIYTFRFVPIKQELSQDFIKR